ncbi:MAG: hypothetical protein L7U72_07275 [Rubripirellula sp.]|nr:hypothetical protein [Rubripirellula sp.]
MNIPSRKTIVRQFAMKLTTIRKKSAASLKLWAKGLTEKMRHTLLFTSRSNRSIETD